MPFWGVWSKYESDVRRNADPAQVLGEEALTPRSPTASPRLHSPTHLFADNMPEAVYRQLVAQVNAGLPAFHRCL